MKFIKLRY